MIEPAHPDSQPTTPLTDPIRQSAAPIEEEAGMGDFTLHLDRVFRGPLDLLLQLVRDKELEIHQIALADVAEAFCAHVRGLGNVDVDEAADYLVIAATLLAIKSRSLLPVEEVELDEDPFDPGEELVQQLLAYKELRAVSDQLAENWDERNQLLPAGGRWIPKLQPEEDEEEEEWDLSDISIWDLLKIISRLEEETGFLRPHRLKPSGRPLRAYVQELWERLQHVSETTLQTLMKEGKKSRTDASFYLVALLELAKQQQVDLAQAEAFADIHVHRAKSQPGFDLDEIDSSFDGQAEELEPEVEELLE
jgi:segregation and condensation protein A